MRTLVLSATMLAFAPTAASAAQLSINTSASHSRSGGAEARTTATSSSVGASAVLGEWEVSATLPYISVSGGGTELTVGGVVIRPDDEEPVSGFGDVFLAAGRALPLGDILPVDVAIRGELKLPTGSRNLSTGKIDAGMDVEVSRQLGSVTPFISTGYRYYGDSNVLELEDGWVLSAGATFTLRGVTIIASYDWSESPLGLAAARELFGVASGAFAPSWNWTVYASKGLSEAAADLMIGIGVSHTLGQSRPLLKK